jgi:HEPN domain-containing protein
MARWERGRATVDELIRDGRLERVQPSRGQADELVAQAKRRLASARLVLESGDSTTAGVVAYDSARLGLTAVLTNEGLRSTTRGGHVAVYEAVKAQLGPTAARVIIPFDRMRRRRNDAEYRSAETSPLTLEEVAENIAAAEAIIDAAERVVATMPRY